MLFKLTKCIIHESLSRRALFPFPAHIRSAQGTVDTNANGIYGKCHLRNFSKNRRYLGLHIGPAREQEIDLFDLPFNRGYVGHKIGILEFYVLLSMITLHAAQTPLF